MGINFINTAEIAKARRLALASGQESSFPKNWSNALVMRAVRSIWPGKTDMALVAKTKRSDRTCRYWLENKYSLGADDLVMLLRTNDGLRILEAVMGDAKPVWWADFRRSVKRAELRRQQKMIQKALDEDEQGEMPV